ncbi:MAG: Rieske 2Fe-2S domain-containing protein [Bacteroidota bacterium]
MAFVTVARFSGISEGQSRRIEVGGEEIALWKVGGRVYAVSNVCAHEHFSMMHQGILKGCMVSCPMHGWTYSLETGRCITGEGRLRTYRVRVEGDDVAIEEPGPAW